MPKATATAAVKIDGCAVVIGITCLDFVGPFFYSLSGALVAVSFNYHKHSLPWVVWYVAASTAGGFMLTPLVLEYLAMDARHGFFFLGSFVAIPILRNINQFDWRRLVNR